MKTHLLLDLTAGELLPVPGKLANRLRALVLALLLATLVLATAGHAHARSRAVGWHQQTATVVAVSDGDTCYLQLGDDRVRVRLARIDAPEKTQAFGRRAEQALRALVWNRTVAASWSEVDGYDRPIVQLTVDGQDINAKMVNLGMAWHYVAFSKDPRLSALEAEARAAKRGLWADERPVPPWEWRKAAKGQH